MPNFYHVEIERLPVVSLPLGENHTLSEVEIKPDNYPNPIDALRRAKNLLDQRCSVSIETPEGTRWDETEIRHRLNQKDL